IAPLTQELHWGMAQVSGLVSLSGVAIALSSPLKAMAVDRWGPRRVALLLTFGMGLATAALAVARTPLALYALFALIGALGPGNINFARTIAEWFEARRGMAYGLMGR